MERCMFCGQVAEMIYVHGHYQCSRCHQVTVPCCNGEMAQRIDPRSLTPRERAQYEQSVSR